MFAANKTFFNKLGGFDTGMEIWGAEQMELSIKVNVLIILIHPVLVVKILV